MNLELADAVVMGGRFVTQIFISYARDDNEVPPDQVGAKGFVDWLYGQVQWRLAQFPEPRPRVWRDTRQIDPGEQFSKELEEAISASDILVVVLSPFWLQRPSCRRELETFAAKHVALGDNRLRERIVCVVKSHVPHDGRPPLLQGQEGYRFFELAEDNNQEIEFFRGRPLNDRCVQLTDGLTRHVYELAGRTPLPPSPEVFPLSPAVPVQQFGPQLRRTPIAERAPDIFLSYAREDVDAVKVLMQVLERRNHRIFWDRRVPPGKTWRTHIGNALECAKCVIVIWSNSSVQSNFVLQEADEAMSRNILVPVRICDIRPPLGFREIQCADLFELAGSRSTSNYLVSQFLDDIDYFLSSS